MSDGAVRLTGPDGSEMEFDTRTGALYNVPKIRQKFLVDRLIDFDTIKFVRDAEKNQTKATFENTKILEEDGKQYEVFGIGTTANDAVRELINDAVGEVLIKNGVKYIMDDEAGFTPVIEGPGVEISL